MAKRKNDLDDITSFEFINDEQDDNQTQQTEVEKNLKEKPSAKKTSTVKESEKQKKSDEQTNKKADISKEAQEYKTLLQLTKAEFDNYRKRSLTLLQDAKTDGEINIISKFLPALDSFKKAKEMIFDEKVLKGVEMIESDINQAFKNIGVEEINPLGKQFDANFHNAISVTNNPDLEDGIVEQVYQCGYSYNGKVIRYAQVIINKTT